MAEQEEQTRRMMEEQAKKMGSVVAKCWSDDSFKKKLLADPAATLTAEGVKIELPAGMTLKTLENTDKVYHIVLPPKPTELSDEQLEVVAGGDSGACWQQCGFCQGTISNPPPPTIGCCGTIFICGCGTFVTAPKKV